MKRAKCFLLGILFLLAGCNLPATSIPLAELAPTPNTGTPLPPAIDAPIAESPSLLSIHMSDEVYGWAVSETQIVRTNDGGVTWYNVTPPDLKETGYSLGAVFLDVNRAWIQAPDMNKYPNAGTLYHTSDGGLTWSFTAVPFSGGQMAFLDPSNGWMMADLGVGAGSNAVAIFQTTDSGVTWNRTYTNDPNLPDAGDSLPLGGLKSILLPLNMQKAWAGGVIYAPGTLYLYRTNDGGGTWIQVNLSVPPDFQAGEISVDEMAFLTPIDGFLTLRFTGETYHTAIYITHDGGNSWKLTPALFPGTGSVNFVSAQEIVFFDGGQFHVTRDAAQTWNIVEPDIVFGESFAYMDFANASTGWVITADPSNQRKLYKTIDGGATWFPIIP